jgi:hypothetical protein
VLPVSNVAMFVAPLAAPASMTYDVGGSGGPGAAHCTITVLPLTEDVRLDGAPGATTDPRSGAAKNSPAPAVRKSFHSMFGPNAAIGPLATSNVAGGSADAREGPVGLWLLQFAAREALNKIATKRARFMAASSLALLHPACEAASLNRRSHSFAPQRPSRSTCCDWVTTRHIWTDAHLGDCCIPAAISVRPDSRERRRMRKASVAYLLHSGRVGRAEASCSRLVSRWFASFL